MCFIISFDLTKCIVSRGDLYLGHSRVRKDVTVASEIPSAGKLAITYIVGEEEF